MKIPSITPHALRHTFGTLCAASRVPVGDIQHYMGHASLSNTDLIIALGVRFDDRVTGRLSSFAPHAKVIHVDIDPAEISKIRNADLPIIQAVGLTYCVLVLAINTAAAIPLPETSPMVNSSPPSGSGRTIPSARAAG